MSESRVVITAQAEQAIREFDRLRAQATGSLRQIGELGGKLDSIHATMGNIVKASIAGVSIDWLVGMVKGSIDTLDNLKDLSATTKISVEDLSGLKLAATQSGAELEGTAEVISKLSANMGKNAEKFALLGVTSKEPLEAFKQFSDVFAAIEDPSLRAAFAADAVGKSWKGAAPLMSEGGQRIGEMVDKGKAMSGVTAEMAARADDFNDQMAEMSARIDGAKMSLAIEMLPALNEFTKRIVDAYNESGKLHAVLVSFETMGAFLFSDEFAAPQEKIKNLREELEGLRSDLATSKNVPFAGGLTRWLFGDSKVDLEAKIAGVELDIQDQQDKIDGPAKEAAAKAAAAADKKAAAEKEKAAAAPAAKATEFLKLTQANEKAAADASLSQHKAIIEADMASRARGLAMVAEMNRQGLASDSAYYVAKREAALAAGTDAVRIRDAEIAALRSMGAKDAAEQTAINGKIAVLNNQKNAALQASLGAADLLRKQYLYDAQAPVRAAQAAADAEVDAVNKEVVALEAQYENYGKLPAAITAATIAKLQARAVALETNEGTEQEIANTNRLIAALQTKAKWEGKVDLQDKGSDLVRANQLLEVMTALDDVARDAAGGMVDSFGRVGDAIGGMTTALTGYGRAQAAIAANLAQEKTDAKGDLTKIKLAETKASQAAATAQIRQYGDMASAGKKFFKEHTAGYKIMEGAEKAFRAYEMAMALQAMVKKIFFKEGEVAANLTLNATKLTGEAATTAASTGLAATEASAWGVTAVVKSLASLPFPWNLAAGAATLAAVVAIGASMMGGIGGGGGAVTPSFEEKQKVQGTGTVLGDSTAKSESMSKSLERMEAYAALELDYQNAMLSALRNIETALGGAAKGIMQTTGITGGSGFGTVNSSSSNFFGSDKTTTIDDTGVKFSGTFGALRAGQGSGVQYEDVIKTSDGGWFHGDSTSKSTNTKALSAEAMKPFALIFDNMGDLLVDAGVKLGKDGATLTNAINGISVDFEVSLRDLKGQELTDALNAGVSVAFDKVTKELFPTIAQFQKMGEGIGETLVRVATDVKAVDSVFASMGKTATGLYSSAGKMASILNGMTVEAKERLVELSGGLDAFASSAKSFMQNFYTEAEQIKAQKAKLNPVLAQYGLTTEGADAEAMFKKFILSLDVTTEAGAKTWATLMSVQQAFKDVTSAAADERADLLAEWDDLTLTSAQKLAKARLEVDPANRALFDQVALQRQLKEATGGTSDALQETIDRLTSTKTSTLAYLDSLKLGSLSTLTPMEKYLETQRQYNAAVDKALANPSDSAAASGAQSAATAFLTASQVINASSAAFIGDKSKVQGDMGRLAAIAGAQLTDAQRQLTALDKQVVSLDQLNGTAAAIQQAIVNQGVAAPAVAPAFDLQRYAASSNAGTEALASEVKALREENAEQRAINAAVLAELKLLRTDTNRNAEAYVDATGEMAEAVTKEVGGAMEQAAYLARNPARVATRG